MAVRLLPVLAVLTAVALAGCAAGPRFPMGDMHRTMWGGGSTDVGPAPSPEPGAVEMAVTTTEFAFDPSELVVSGGEAVNIVLTNEGTIEHDLTIPELGFRLLASPGETVAGSLVAAEPGRYDFLCALSGHAQAGMTGTLVVR
ncbi:MAG: cupredoxin domain-containing protein [Chloroflexota bacterium]